MATLQVAGQLLLVVAGRGVLDLEVLALERNGLVHVRRSAVERALVERVVLLDRARPVRRYLVLGHHRVYFALQHVHGDQFATCRLRLSGARLCFDPAAALVLERHGVDTLGHVLDDAAHADKAQLLLSGLLASRCFRLMLAHNGRLAEQVHGAVRVERVLVGVQPEEDHLVRVGLLPQVHLQIGVAHGRRGRRHGAHVEAAVLSGGHAR